MTGANENEIVSSWTKTRNQVLSYAKVEKKSAVKKLILHYYDYEEQSNDSKCQQGYFVFLYTIIMLATKGGTEGAESG